MHMMSHYPRSQLSLTIQSIAAASLSPHADYERCRVPTQELEVGGVKGFGLFSSACLPTHAAGR